MMIMMMRKILLDTLTVNVLPCKFLMRRILVLLLLMKENDNNVIGVDNDDYDRNKIYNNNGETEGKDEAFYQRSEQSLKRATIFAKLRKHIEETRSMQK